jgi:hypothetical protein
VMPQAIRVMDLDDRSCTFVPEEEPPRTSARKTNGWTAGISGTRYRP